MRLLALCLLGGACGVLLVWIVGIADRAGPRRGPACLPTAAERATTAKPAATSEPAAPASDRALTAGAEAQSAPPAPAQAPAAPPLRPAARLVLPSIDRERLTAEAQAREAACGLYRFATPIPVDVTPETAGLWEELEDGAARWRLEIEAAGAESINLGFTAYHMPPGGSLEVAPHGGPSPYRRFTADDNEEHGQLWTPLIEGSRMEVFVDLPAGRRDGLELVLNWVNAGFRAWDGGAKIGGDASGACNIDVACDASVLPAVGPLIDLYRDQIRSVGAYTIQGIDTCCGALVNNTARDGRPFFLSAYHCGPSASNAPSMVVYWQYENSYCRMPGSAASGRPGDGDLRQFNSGAIFRARREVSDFALVELDDPVAPAVNAYYAGWDRGSADATMAACVHHPALAEKRISFELDRTRTTEFYGSASPGDGTHIRVADWDYGTTEHGSSGSPLFNQDGCIIGQLHGGDAACGNDEPDWYGRLAVSWAGGGAPATRLSDWLDPLRTGVLTLDGQYDGPALRIEDATCVEGSAGVQVVPLHVTLYPPAEEPLTVRYSTADDTALAIEDYQPRAGAALVFQPGATEAWVNLLVRSDTAPEEHERFALHLAPAEGAVLIRPRAWVTILNDDYVAPLIIGPLRVTAYQRAPFTHQVGALHTPTEYALGDAPAGMTIETATGLVSWTPAQAGAFTARVAALNPAGADEQILTIRVEPSSVGHAVDNLDLPWTNSPAAEWFMQRDVTQDGIDAAQSGPVGDYEASWLEARLQGPDTLEFWWSVSSEAGYDELQFALDGRRLYAISGERAWQQRTVTIPAGAHTIRWTYAKDGSLSTGADAGWVDGVRLRSQAGRLQITSPAEVWSAAGLPFSYQLCAAPEPASFAADDLPAGWMVSAAGRLSGPSMDATSVGILARAIGAAGAEETARIVFHFLPRQELAPEAAPAGITFLTEGRAPWTVDSTHAHSAPAALRSGQVAHGQSSALHAIIPGPGRLEFWWLVSSEEDADTLSVSLDGTVQKAISGKAKWERFSLAVSPGQHTVAWSYEKDAAGSAGDDAGWIDDIQLTGYAGWALAQGALADRDIRADSDRDGQPNAVEYALGLDPTRDDAGQAARVAVENGFLTLRLQKPAGVTGLSYRAEVTGDLGAAAWTSAATTVLVDDSTQWAARDNIAVTDARCRFIRLRVDLE